ncbi:MAG: hypothetical protein CML66_17760 [Rhodobacteraceae bacterium]|nr:hypothetical protein [Paracoccaceae bacterium]MAY44806.1 hypothetical protein [Paracoccaceae bacterium]QEW21765.1 hypothetical protein LA6_003977 [Marinibacterium anthonyi]
MIRYSLKCSNGHAFDSWFQSAEAFDKLAGAGMVSCSVCGAGEVEKSMMAPRVRSSRKAAKPDLRAPGSEAEAAVRAIRKTIEENADYVGLEFAREARAMHNGETPGRAIYGEARLDEARKLVEEGVTVAPLPFMPSRKAN